MLGLRSVLAATIACAAAGAAPPHAPVMPGPGPQVRTGSVENGSCEACHTTIAAEWRQSLHSASFTDSDFQRARGREGSDDPFCRNCHAPEARPELGVACVTCHVPTRDVLAAPRPESDPRAPSPHRLLRTPEFGGLAACARCHEFDFPDATSRRAPLAMQRTVTEHRQSGTTATCAGCHMPKTNGHANHRFVAARDPAFVKSGVRVEARRTADRAAIEVVLSPAAIGHAFPTGDLFRRVRVRIGRATRFLARHYTSRQERPGVFVRSEVSDDRVLGGDRTVTLPAPAMPTRVEVVYERAEGPSDTTRGSAAVAGAVVLFEGDL